MKVARRTPGPASANLQGRKPREGVGGWRGVGYGDLSAAPAIFFGRQVVAENPWLDVGARAAELDGSAIPIRPQSARARSDQEGAPPSPDSRNASSVDRELAGGPHHHLPRRCDRGGRHRLHQCGAPLKDRQEGEYLFDAAYFGALHAPATCRS